ncbi:MAG: helix-turn-helix transcriptional regulator [Clostridia bacterium]|nr:helix-turn-helix transcriptional regulator [Clostridia bacterium]
MRLKALRKERGISQVKLSMDLNLSQNTISRYETGVREADYKTLILIADYFDVSIDYLLERTDNPVFLKSQTTPKRT